MNIPSLQLWSIECHNCRRHSCSSSSSSSWTALPHHCESDQAMLIWYTFPFWTLLLAIILQINCITLVVRNSSNFVTCRGLAHDWCYMDYGAACARRGKITRIRSAQCSPDTFAARSNDARVCRHNDAPTTLCSNTAPFIPKRTVGG
jgi:hypothetical protein